MTTATGRPSPALPLALLGRAYGAVAAWRRTWYDTHPQARRRLHHPVVSVGNLAVGGRGKTPVVAALAELLIAQGERPAILSRGYGRREAAEGVVVVSDGQAVREPVSRAGDEPLLLARRLPSVPVLVCGDRYLAGTLAESRLGVTVHLLDDGFQHLPLARDIDLLLLDPADLDDAVLPAGRLREPVTTVARADAHLFVGPQAEAMLREADESGVPNGALGITPRFMVETTLGAPRAVTAAAAPVDRSSGAHADVTPGRVVVLTGIAGPSRVVDALTANGWTVTRALTYRDHHWFTPREVQSAFEAARADGAVAVMTTEKDAVRLEGCLPIDAPCPLIYLPLDARVTPAAVFADWIASRLTEARAGRPAHGAA